MIIHKPLVIFKSGIVTYVPAKTSQEKLIENQLPFIKVIDYYTDVIAINWGLDENLIYNELEVIIFDENTSIDNWVNTQLMRKKLLELNHV